MMTSPTVSWKSLNGLFFALLLLIPGHFALAKTSISWDVKQKRVIGGNREVDLSIKASEAGTVYVKKEKLFHLGADKSVNRIDDENIIKQFPFDLKQNETQTITMVLPPGLIQMPIEFESAEKKDPEAKESLLISFKTDITTNLPQQEQREIQIKGTDRKVLIAGGLGVTYLRYAQSSDVTIGSLTFANVNAPSLTITGELGLTETFSFASFLHVAPGSVEGSPQLQFRSEAYQWIIYGLEGLHQPEFGKFEVWKRQLSLGYRFGVQFHQMPFISRTSTNGIANIETNFVGNLSAGPHVEYKIDENFLARMFIRFQYPMFWGFLFKLEPAVAFDGNLSLHWRPDLDSGWHYSAHWFGQQHSYQYNHVDVLLQGDSAGSLDLFFSGIDFRAGYEF